MAKRKQPQPRVKPIGKALRWTDEDIARLAEVTPEDIACAKAEFNRLAPRKLRGLLDAKPERRKR
jgi:hypothetical protein